MKIHAKECLFLLSIQMKENMSFSIVFNAVKAMNFDEVFYRVVKFDKIIINRKS